MYMFVSKEGHTFQPQNNELPTEIDNLQVIGISNGQDENEAFLNLLDENLYLRDSTFNEVFSIQIDSNFENNKKYFCIKSGKQS